MAIASSEKKLSLIIKMAIDLLIESIEILLGMNEETNNFSSPMNESFGIVLFPVIGEKVSVSSISKLKQILWT